MQIEPTPAWMTLLVVLLLGAVAVLACNNNNHVFVSTSLDSRINSLEQQLAQNRAAMDSAIAHPEQARAILSRARSSQPKE